MFMNQFEPAITRKVNPKRQTIRPLPKRMPKSGELESWRVWTGRPYNSPQRELVQVRIEFVILVEISNRGIIRMDNGTHLKPKYVATKDGFENWRAMKAWFQKQHGLPFKGILIYAEDLEPTEPFYGEGY